MKYFIYDKGNGFTSISFDSFEDGMDLIAIVDTLEEAQKIIDSFMRENTQSY